MTLLLKLSYSINLKYINLDLPGSILTENGSGCIPNPSDFFKNKELWHCLLKHWASSFWSTAIQSLNHSKKNKKRTITLRGTRFFLENTSLPNQNKKFSFDKSIRRFATGCPPSPICRQSDLPGPIFGLSAPALMVGEVPYFLGTRRTFLISG